MNQVDHSDKVVRHTINGVEVMCGKRQDPETGEWKRYRVKKPKTDNSPEVLEEISQEGEHKSYYGSGRLSCVYTIKNGKYEGKWESWDEEGRRCCVQFFKEGMRQGEAINWFNGKKISRRIYKDDQVIAASDSAGQFGNKGKPWYEGDIELEG